ncbi:uncharacterized protein LOC107459541 [Arachis duranensis]|uniref:Uncharacterized protein LOC107459541 n=1 Tax=Arachis duranensis TaxID=130453 RepID=A0A6P4B396_ARADU|nr:uncharacterized protein LOC107459541 [Arachis duranensis]
MAAVASPSSRNQTPSSSRSFSYPFASYTSANFAPGVSPIVPTRFSSSFGHHRRCSSTSSPPCPASVRFSSEQPPGTPGQRSTAINKNQRKTDAISSSTSNHQRRTCMCSPTTHPGSFRCSYHKRLAEQQQQQTALLHCASSSSGNTLNLRRLAMQNSLVRIGGVEGELVKRALCALIRPSSHSHRRREAFQPRPSRLSVMSKAEHY